MVLVCRFGECHDVFQTKPELIDHLATDHKISYATRKESLAPLQVLSCSHVGI